MSGSSESLLTTALTMLRALHDGIDWADLDLDYHDFRAAVLARYTRLYGAEEANRIITQAEDDV